MKIRSPWLIRSVAFVLAAILRLWCMTIRFRSDDEGHKTNPGSPETSERYIYAFWHEYIFVGVRWGLVADLIGLISKHEDGELISLVGKYFGLKTIRGSTTRGGAEAIRQMMRDNSRSHIAIAVDGPRGPRRVAQMGAVYLASRTGMPLVACGISATKAWRAKSWDRFMLPRPIAKAYTIFSKSIHVPPDLERDQLEPYRAALQAILDETSLTAEQRAGVLGEDSHGQSEQSLRLSA